MDTLENNSIKFIKMHALGNDFVILDHLTTTQQTQLAITQLADRHQGIGFDQLLMIYPSTQAHFSCCIFNADGSEATQCCNGLRCAAEYLYKEGKAPRHMTLETKSGIYSFRISSHSVITMQFLLIHVEQPQILRPKPHSTWFYTRIFVGNWHAIIRVNQIGKTSLPFFNQQLNASLNQQDHYNIGIIEIMNPNHIRLRTLERGVGETLACGSSACAAVAAGIINQWLDTRVKVQFRYGSVQVDCSTDFKHVELTGPVTRVFSGILA